MPAGDAANADPFEDPHPGHRRKLGAGRKGRRETAELDDERFAGRTDRRAQPDEQAAVGTEAVPSTFTGQSPARTSSCPLARVASMNARRASSLIGKARSHARAIRSTTSRWRANGLRQTSRSTRAPGRSTTLASRNRATNARLAWRPSSSEPKCDPMTYTKPSCRASASPSDVRRSGRAEPTRDSLDLPAPAVAGSERPINTIESSTRCSSRRSNTTPHSPRRPACPTPRARPCPARWRSRADDLDPATSRQGTFGQIGDAPTGYENGESLDAARPSPLSSIRGRTSA